MIFLITFIFTLSPSSLCWFSPPPFYSWFSPLLFLSRMHLLHFLLLMNVNSGIENASIVSMPISSLIHISFPI